MAKAKKAPKKPVKKKLAVKAKPKAQAKAKAKAAKPAKLAKKAAAAKASAKGKAAVKPAAKKAAGKAEKPQAAAKGAGSKASATAKAGKGGKADVKTVEVTVEVEAIEAQPAEEVVLTDAEGRRYCRVKDCDQLATVDAYCRYHYLLFWKRIQIRKKILTEGKLERYIEELTARYPDKFLDMLRKDLRSEKEFLAAIQELEIDESQAEGEFEEESENIIDEVRGMSEAPERTEEEF